MDRKIVNKMLPDGRICIHWLRLTKDGPIETAANVVQTQLGPLKLGGLRGEIACNPTQNWLGPVEKGMERLMCHRSDDARAVTCPECMATQTYKDAMAELANIQAHG